MSLNEGTNTPPKGRQFRVEAEGVSIIQEQSRQLRLNQPETILLALKLLEKHTADKRVQTVEETFAAIVGV